jgi:hypothetical protein
MPELSELVRNLEEHVVRFYAWADAYPPAERSAPYDAAPATMMMLRAPSRGE